MRTTTVNFGSSDVPMKQLPYNSEIQYQLMALNNWAHLSSSAVDNHSSIVKGLILASDALTCPCCSKLFVHPISLSCGFSVCTACMPKFDPATVENFDCPVQECTEKSHLFRELKVDVTIHKLSQLMSSELANNQHLSIFKQPIGPTSHLPIPDIYHDKCKNSISNPASSSILSLESSTASDDCTEDCRTEVEIQPSSWKENMLNELECQVCCFLLNEPVTIPCGHTFCKSCLLRFADHNNKCAICRCPLPIARVLQTHPSNSTLSCLISTIFPFEQMERKEALKKEEEQASSYAPIFVCSIGFPTIPCYLHIFEPRYRLMIRRCTAPGASRKFGICMALTCKRFPDIGTMMEIEGVEQLNDGRYLVKTVGLYRFRIKKHGMRDGYHTAQVERFDDDGADDLKYLHTEVTDDAPMMAHCNIDAMAQEARTFGRLLQRSNIPWILYRIIRTNSQMPTDLSSLSWWLAATMPIDDQNKYLILHLTTTHDRLKLICEWIEQVKKQWWFRPLIYGTPISLPST
jgi:Lon protease-like protein